MYRAYFFANFYLSSMQQGIQSAHALGEMVSRYHNTDSDEWQHMHDWASQGRTIIIYNGGDSYKIENTYASMLMSHGRHSYPTSIFQEGGLDRAVTAAGIILPQKVYSLAREARNGKVAARKLLCGTNDDIYIKKSNMGVEEVVYTDWEVQMADFLNKQSLAK